MVFGQAQPVETGPTDGEAAASGSTQSPKSLLKNFDAAAIPDDESLFQDPYLYFLAGEDAPGATDESHKIERPMTGGQTRRSKVAPNWNGPLTVPRSSLEEEKPVHDSQETLAAWINLYTFSSNLIVVEGYK